MAVWQEGKTWCVPEHLFLLQGWEKDNPYPFEPFPDPQKQAQKNPQQAYLFLTCGEPLLKASYHEFKAFKEWILTAIEELERSPPSHPFAISLLKQFSYVFPNEILAGLAHKRSIYSSTTLILTPEPYSQTSQFTEWILRRLWRFKGK